jgi:hypothetical protein
MGTVKYQNLVTCYTISRTYLVVSHEAYYISIHECINPLNTELNPICHLLALLGAHHILHVSRIRVKMSLCQQH